MALTSDEIKQILELRAKKYSHRKNAEKTGHSEITVRKVINEAEGQVISLKAKGLEMEQIAKELDYPLAFVRNTVDKPGSLSVEPLEVDVEQRESPETPDLKTGWAGFKRLQEIGSAAKRLQQQADKLIDDLQELEMQLKAERIVSADWYQRKQLLEGQLRNFVLEEVQIIDSEESVSALEGVIEEIKEKVSSLCQVYKPKVKEAKKLRSLQEQKHSDQLLDEKIAGIHCYCMVKCPSHCKYSVINGRRAALPKQPSHKR